MGELGGLGERQRDSSKNLKRKVIEIICNRMDIVNFRNIEEASVTFSDGVNLLHGDNAQGKTNLLEAIYFTALGKKTIIIEKWKC